MRVERQCSFYWSSEDPERGSDCRWCKVDRTHAVCHREKRDCVKLKFLKKTLMERVWMKAKKGGNQIPEIKFSNKLIAQDYGSKA